MVDYQIEVPIAHSSDPSCPAPPPPPNFKEGREVNFNYLPRRGESEKLRKGWKYGPGAVFLKRGGWGGTFPT